MIRYFVVPDAHMPGSGDSVGHWHALDLASHGTAGAGYHVVVLMDDFVPVPTGWIAFPRLVDPTTTVTDVGLHAWLVDIGIASTATMYEAAQPLGAIHPMMGH